MESLILGVLEQEHMLRLSEGKGSVTPHVKKLRDTHHRLARLLAAGHKEGHVAALSGYSLSRLSILKNDPSFIELVSYYRLEVNEVHLDAERQLAGLRSDAIDELVERLETSPEKISNKDLLNIATYASDRTGLGPKKTLNLNAVVLSTDDIKKLKGEVSQNGEIIDVTGQSVVSSRQAQSNPGSNLGLLLDAGRPIFDLEPGIESMPEEGVDISKESIPAPRLDVDI